MFKHVRPVFAEIDLDNLAFNLKGIRNLTKGAEMIGVVKADAYGHGAVDVVPTLLENGVTRLAVAVVSEAAELRNAGIDVPIMILGYTPMIMAGDIFKYGIEPTVFSYEYVKKLSKLAEKDKVNVKVHIAVDTGMGRIGFLPNEESVQDVYKISKLPNIIIEGLFSHFSTSDERDKEYSNLQLEKYKWFVQELENKGILIKIKHIANSAAIMDLPHTNFQAVRPGIILYGYYPSDEVQKNNLKLKPVMTLKTNIVHLKTLKKGEYISYGRKFQCERDSVIATIPVGYADGYSRQLGPKAKVIINDTFAPVVGRICMDQCMIDVTDIKGLKVGDEVILMGQSENCKFNADDMAEILGTINYEIICLISKRVPRVYIKNNKTVKIRNYI